MTTHLVVLAGVEGAQVKLLQWLCVPQAQVAAAGGVVARDGVVEGHSPHLRSSRWGRRVDASTAGCTAVMHQKGCGSWLGPMTDWPTS